MPNQEETKDVPRGVRDNSFSTDTKVETALLPQERKDPFGKIIRTFKCQKITTVTIEAGHIYADQLPNKEQSDGFALASEICSRLSANGIISKRIVFIDDYNAQRNGFSLQGYLQCADDCGFPPEVVFWESEMVQHAEKLIGELAQMGQVQNGNDQEQHTVRPKIKLRHADGRLTCAILDAAFHLERLKQFGQNITVLPKCSEHNPELDYGDQQRNMRRLLRLLGNDQLPLVTVFFDRERNPAVVPFQ